MSLVDREMLAAFAAYGLPGSLQELPAGPLPESHWRQFLRGVVRHRLQGHLAAAVADGNFAVDEAQRDEVLTLHRDAIAQVLRLERRLVEVSERLSSAGIEHRLLKGTALAHLAYPRSDRRVFGDIDLLVDGLDAGIEVLREAGHRRRQPALTADFAGRFGKGVTLVAPDDVEVDLHRTLVAGPFGLTLDLEAMFEPGPILHLGDRQVPTIDHDRLLLHACYTVALAGAAPRLGALRDLAQLMLECEVSSDRFLDLAHRSEAGVVAASAITMTWDELRLADVVPLVVWARDRVPTSEEQRWMRAYRTGTFGALTRASMGALSGIRERLAFLRAVATPSREFLEDRQQGPIGWLWRGMRRSVASADRTHP